MLIIGLLIAFSTIAFSGILRAGFERKTFSDMEVIGDAITVYTQKHMRVPCPADPAGGGAVPPGFERNPGGNTAVFGQCNTIATAEGIIPYATLGLSQRAARDRFGNFITYRVSITSAQTPVVSSALPINNWCMTEPYWYKDTTANGTADSYVSLAKAAFCCGTWGGGAAPAGTAGDINLQGSFGTLPDVSRGVDGFGGHLNEYRLPAVAAPTRAELLNPAIPGFADVTIPPVFPAYILVSHGQNGLGAYHNGVHNIAGLVAGSPEEENADSSNVNYFAPDRLAPVSPGGGNPSLYRPNIDDIVFWQTPAQVLGRIGGVSCSHP
jgi:hypothetical protein